MTIPNGADTDADMVTVDVAEMLDRHPSTIAAWRVNRTGPPFVRVGRRVRYRREDVEQWARQRGLPCYAGGRLGGTA